MQNQEIQIYQKRIEQFRKRIEDYILPESVRLEAEYGWSKEAVPFESRFQLSYKSIEEGDFWGNAWESAWFHLKGRTPREWKNREVVAQLNFSGEALIFSEEGVPLQGLTNSSVYYSSVKKEIFPLFKSSEGGEEVELWVEAAATTLFGVYTEMDPAPDSPKRYGQYDAKVVRIRLCTFDRDIWRLTLDIDILLGLLKHLPENSVRFARVLRALNEAINIFADNPRNAGKSLEVLKPVMNKPAHASELTVYAVGHAHIDTAWLWTVAETVRKCARTFASQVALIKEYPEYIFGASQPQHYQFVKTHYPALYREIRDLVKQGRWELQGGMWVEADCNLISGESMVRQILHGKNFFMDEFGVDVKNLWLPDVFGYSAALPQILQKSGIDYFLTQKLSWNQINDFPHTTFVWRGIDGSEVLTHFPPENTYNSQLNTEFLIPGRNNFREKDFMNEFISLFGIGDGGGGPKAEYIEYGRRMANLEGAPKVKFASAGQFFEQAEKYRRQLPLWMGELYLETHRGTLTSQAKVKKANRKLEFKLRTLEMLWSCLPPERYPQKEFDDIWKKVLINQFHDIIPGSSIRKTYEITEREHEQATARCEELEKQAAELLFEKDDDSLVIFNSLPFECDELITLPEDWSGASDEQGNPVPVQKSDGCVIAKVRLPGLSFVNLKKADSQTAADSQPKQVDNRILENSRIRYEFNEKGQLIRAYDKEAGRSVLKDGESGNVLQLFEDRPNEWDAWDIDLFYEEQLLEEATLIGSRKIEEGALNKGLFFEFRVGKSRIEQKIFLRNDSKRLDFNTRVEWKEKHRMLRVSFKADVNADQAAFDIQYGYMHRPAHRNTSWDRAQFESVGHKYADLSQPDYGAALLNDCKYGYKVEDGELNLNLLRSPTYPDPDCDQGLHTFVYSFLPHTGDLVNSDVMEEALKLNQPPLVFYGTVAKIQGLPFVIKGQRISLEAVKKAEKDNSLVVRMVEIRGRQTQVYLEFRQQPEKIVESDLLEWNDLNQLPAEKLLNLDFKPFEIKTLKIFW
ncbi:MAG: alpha-mannosidase [Calditrichaeota bacterium]|nr:alpha-mannosidase [Calditrichota bacterium]